MARLVTTDTWRTMLDGAIRTTANPIQLALWAGHGSVIVFATYASLVDRDDPEEPTGPGTRPRAAEGGSGGRRAAVRAADGRLRLGSGGRGARYCRRRRPTLGSPSAGVEGTIRQAVAVTDLHQARYRGLAKTHLEHVCSAVALNLIRLDAWWHGHPLDRTRTSHLARLELRLAA